MRPARARAFALRVRSVSSRTRPARPAAVIARLERRKMRRNRRRAMTARSAASWRPRDKSSTCLVIQSLLETFVEYFTNYPALLKRITHVFESCIVIVWACLPEICENTVSTFYCHARVDSSAAACPAPPAFRPVSKGRRRATPACRARSPSRRAPRAAPTAALASSWCGFSAVFLSCLCETCADAPSRTRAQCAI
jgi:hypothetical protein